LDFFFFIELETAVKLDSGIWRVGRITSIKAAKTGNNYLRI
jgi:hypothetical protein